MEDKKNVDVDVSDLFKKPHIPIIKSKKIEVWQVHPIKKGTRIFTETH